QDRHNFVHFAYIAFFIRVAWWWRQEGRAVSLEWPSTLRTILLWHVPSAATYLLLPKRFSHFMWYLSPYATDQHRESIPFMHGLPYYLRALTDDYLPLGWGLYLVAGMVLLGLVSWRKLKPGAAALIFFLFFPACVVCQHPMLKNRMMHSFIASMW